MNVYGTDWQGKPCVLVHDATGYPVEIDEKVYDFRGEPAYINGGTAPRTPESTGRVHVYIHDEEGTYFPEFFPGVYGLKWRRLQ